MWNLKVKVKVREISFLLQNEGLRPNMGYEQDLLVWNVWLGIGKTNPQSREIFHVLLEHTVHLLY